MARQSRLPYDDDHPQGGTGASSSWFRTLGWLSTAGAVGSGLYFVGKHVTENLPSIQHQFQGVLSKQLHAEQKLSELSTQATDDSVHTIRNIIGGLRSSIPNKCGMNKHLRKLKNPELPPNEKAEEWKRVTVIGITRYMVTIYSVVYVTWAIRVMYAAIANAVYHGVFNENSKTGRSPEDTKGDRNPRIRIVRIAVVDALLRELHEKFLPQLIDRFEMFSSSALDDGRTCQSKMDSQGFRSLIQAVRAREEDEGSVLIRLPGVGNSVDIEQASNQLGDGSRVTEENLTSVENIGRAILNCYSDCVDNPLSATIVQNMLDESVNAANNFAISKLFSSSTAEGESMPLGSACFELRNVANTLLSLNSDASVNELIARTFHNQHICSFSEKILRYADPTWVATLSS
eukprot:gb/GECG01014423.1/.p1 GENE.gb/GECG01014423.1/~~gb/GECG01014423.1/.p1  ORF type:complete len:403 (+),score=44.14 gb/GECG01014423.1/:1-1209(+)